MKRILSALAILIIAGIIGAGLGFGTRLVYRTDPYFRAARKLMAEVDNLEVLNIKYNEEQKVLSMMLLVSGPTPDAEPLIEEAYRSIMPEDAELLVTMTIFYFPDGYFYMGVASDYWVSGMYTQYPKLLGTIYWNLEAPYSFGYWIPITKDKVDGWRMW